MNTESSADHIFGSSHGRFSCAASSFQVPAPSVAEIKTPYASYLFLFSSFQPFRRHHFMQSTPRLSPSDTVACSTMNRSTLPSVLFPIPVFQICKQLGFQKLGYLEAVFGTVDLLPQDLLSADVVRECSQSRNAEDSTMENLSKGSFSETPSKFVFFSVISVANPFTRS